MTDFRRSQNGYTLVELLVIVTILIAVAALAYPSIQLTRKFRVGSETSELLGHLQKIRCDSITSRSLVTSRGFGIKFTDSGTAYSLFEFNDLDGDFKYDGAGEENGPRVINLPDDIEIKKENSSMPNGTTLLFDSKGMVRNADWGMSGLTIVVSHENNDVNSRCIVVSTVRVREGIWNVDQCD